MDSSPIAENNTISQGLWHNKPVGYKLGMLLLMALASTFLFYFLAIVAIIPLCGVNLLANPSALSNLDDANVINAFKVIQVFNQLGLFIVPVIVLAYLVNKNIGAYLQLKTKTKPAIYVITILLMIAALPVINLLGELNNQLSLPSSLKFIEDWMRQSEQQAARITEAFLQMDSPVSLIINLIIIAFLAGLGEELLFRGALQRLLGEWFKNKHIAIWLSAIIFSAIHMQFFGFFPRMLLGALFGYLLLWSNNLWIPILAHFTNNACAVIVSYLTQKDVVSESAETIGAQPSDYLIAGVGVVLTSALLYFIRKKLKENI